MGKFNNNNITSLLLKEYNKNVKSTREVEEEKRRDKEEEERRKILELRCGLNNKRNKKSEFACKCKKGLMHETIKSLFDKSTTNLLSSQMNESIKISLINQFINEEGVDRLMRRFYVSSELLSEYAANIDRHYKLLVEKSCKSEDYDSVEPDEDFYDSLNSDDAEEVADVIRTRVNNDIDKFVVDNTNDMGKIKEVLQKTQEKISKIDPMADNAEKLEENYTLESTRMINKIRNSREKSVLEAMVYNVSKSAMTNEKLKEMYLENGMLDDNALDNILESCKVMYTFLEMLNTAKMKKIDESYITEMLKGL